MPGEAKPSGIKPKYITILMLVLVAAAVVFWKLQVAPRQKANTYVPKPEQQAPGLGAQVYEQTQNPVAGQVPSTNPFDKPANPIEGSYTNPF